MKQISTSFVQEEMARNSPSDPRCEDVNAFCSIFTLALGDFMETHLLVRVKYSTEYILQMLCF